MKIFPQLTVLCLFVSSGLSAQYSANDHIFRAQQWMDIIQPGSAEAELTAALALNPNEQRAYFNRGLCRLDLDNVAGAREDFLRVVQLNPADAEAWLLLGDCYQFLLDYPQAEAAYNRSYQERPVAETLLARADLFLQSDRLRAAERDYRIILNTTPNHAGAHRGLGDLALLAADARRALQHYDRALRADARDASTWYNRAQANLQLQQKRAAATDLDRALEIAPDNADALALRALCRLESDSYRAETDARRARRLDKENGMSWYCLALLERGRGNTKTALQHLDMSLLCEPNNSDFRYERGALAYNFGYYEAARLDWQQVLEQQPDHALAQERMQHLRGMLSDRLEMANSVPVEMEQPLAGSSEEFVVDIFEH